jgi:Flp pilus assembly protein TadD
MIESEFADVTNAVTRCAEGALLAEAGDYFGAISCYRDAIALAPAVLELHLVLANALTLHGDVLGARTALRYALRVAYRADVISEYSLGKALVDAGAGADAVPCFRRARAERPQDPAASAALAAALRDAQQPDAAWTEVQHALRLAPREPAALLTAALIRHDLADFAGALALCEQSLAVRPDSAPTRVTRGYLRHLLGESAGGYSDFESRPLPVPGTPAQRWLGEPLAGQSILLLGEQGVGDQFQFLRFALHPLVQQAARVVIACQPDAVSLLRHCGFDAVSRCDVPVTDLYVPIQSLPVLLSLGAEWSPPTLPYLSLPDVAATHSVGAAPRRVGVVWAGNPAHRNDAARSVDASLLHGMLHSNPKLQFIALQHGVPASDVPTGFSASIQGGDWLSTARHLLSLDLLISVDTGVAHLAGALGIPVWILLPYVPDWRWGTRGNATPWYPSARLFRQPARGDWSRLLTQVQAALSL